MKCSAPLKRLITPIYSIPLLNLTMLGKSLFYNIANFLGTIGFVENELDGLQLKNVIELEVIGTRDCSTMIERSLEKVGLLDEEDLSNNEDLTLMVQFQVILPILAKLFTIIIYTVRFNVVLQSI